jgi:hypothetical protein
MGTPHSGVCWAVNCTRDASCAGLSADPNTPRVCAPYKITAVVSTDNAPSCTSDAQCGTGGICDLAANNFNPGGLYGPNAGIFGPNGKCRQVSWALHCAPSLGAAKLGAGAACVHSDDCRTGHCLTPGNYCFGGCAIGGTDCAAGTTCKPGTYLGLSANFCQP